MVQKIRDDDEDCGLAEREAIICYSSCKVRLSGSNIAEQDQPPSWILGVLSCNLVRSLDRSSGRILTYNLASKGIKRLGAKRAKLAALHQSLHAAPLHVSLSAFAWND